MTDNGSGVDPDTLAATAGEYGVNVSYDSSTSVATLNLRQLGSGRYVLVLTATDYQETKNDENADALLPNTTTIRIPVVVG